VYHRIVTKYIQVQDLIHPSLCKRTAGSKLETCLTRNLDPYMADMTPLLPNVMEPKTENGKFKTMLRGTHPAYDDSHKLVSAFAWIPAIFAVSDDGRSVEIDGYINGLGSRKQYPLVYDLLEQTFLVVMPLLEKAASHEFEVKESASRRYRHEQHSPKR
jgi:hypothetical protein